MRFFIFFVNAKLNLTNKRFSVGFVYFNFTKIQLKIFTTTKKALK
jgi:hypothetical protein